MPLSGTFGGGGLAAPAASRQGIPVQVLGLSAPPTEEAMSEIIQMIRGGQVGAERFMELLSLLAGASVPNLTPQVQQEQPPEEQPGGGQLDIMSLLGGS